MPPLVFFAAAMGQSERYQPNFSNVMGALGILLILILWSWVFYLCTEKHTSTIRSWIYRIVGVKSGKLFTIN